MKKYELLYIIPPKYTEDEIKSFYSEIKKIIKEADSKILKEEDWGKKKLAYKIKTFRYGYYGFFVFMVEPSKILEISKKLHLMQEILRYQIVISPKERKAPTGTGKPKQIDKEKEKSPIKSVDEGKKDKKKEKIDLDNLDEKLDKILEDAI